MLVDIIPLCILQTTVIQPEIGRAATASAFTAPSGVMAMLSVQTVVMKSDVVS